MRRTLFCLIVFIVGFDGRFAFANKGAVDWASQKVERHVEGEYRIHLVSADPKVNHFWISSPPATRYQQSIEQPFFSVAPSNQYEESTFGNKINYWDFTDRNELSVTMKLKLKVSNFLSEIDPTHIGSYDQSSAEYQLYTRDERLTHVNQVVRQAKEEIEATLRGEKNPYFIAKATFTWIMDHMAYATLDTLGRDRGIEALTAAPFESGDLVYYKGDCGEYTFFYNSILRAFGIPARMAIGGWSIEKDQWHAWSEILVPNYGWVPVDTSVADVFLYDEGEELNQLGRKDLNTPLFAPVKSPYFYFGNLDPYRFVMSIGTDIAIEPSMPWDFSEYKLSAFYHKGTAGYLQIGIFNVVQVEARNLSISFKED
jgi:hypothetical protein